MKLTITAKNHIREWYDFFLWTVFFILGIIYIIYRDGTDNLFVLYIFLGVQFVPTAYLHIMYYLKNKEEEYSIEKDKIIRIKDGKKVIYNSKDIKKIVICKSASQEGWGIPYTTFETFCLARIYLNNNTFFIMTNLLEYDLEKSLKTLKNVQFERRKGFSFFI